MKISYHGDIKKSNNGNYYFVIALGLGEGVNARNITMPISIPVNLYEAQKEQPVRSEYSQGDKGYYLFHDAVVRVDGSHEQYAYDEVLTRIKHFVLKREKDFGKIAKEVEAFERMTETETARRERIPDSVKLFVWQRDQGKCANCGSKEKLEFDHIIAVAEGGSSTERNIQLLCERCNRAKGKNIL